MSAECDFSASLTCPRCGYRARSQRTRRVCRPVPDTFRPVDIGAVVERGLSAIGITKERVERLTGTAQKPGGCGCGRRKAWLTKAGDAAQRAIHESLLKAKKFYVGD